MMSTKLRGALQDLVLLNDATRILQREVEDGFINERLARAERTLESRRDRALDVVVDVLEEERRG